MKQELVELALRDAAPSLWDAFMMAYGKLEHAYALGFAEARETYQQVATVKAPAVNWVPQDQPAPPIHWDPQGC